MVAMCVATAFLGDAVLATAAPVGKRPPVVAGQFYAGSRAELVQEVDAALAQARAPLGPRPVALIAPHASYVFCGRVVGEAWRQAQQHRYDLIVILGTNHTAPGFHRVSVWPEGAWETPLGEAAVDARAAAALVAADPTDCVTDTRPHRFEHSVEVQVPFAQRLFPGVPILPVIVGSEDLGLCERFGNALAAVVRDRRALIVASSDLSHYPPKAEAEEVDRAVLASLATLDPREVQKTMRAQMGRGVPDLVTCACGEAPILAALIAAKALGAGKASVVAYANSADVREGDPWRVVGYGAVSITANGRPPSGGAGREGSRASGAAGGGRAAPAGMASAHDRRPPTGAGPATASHFVSAADRAALLRMARATIRASFGDTTLGGSGCPPRLQARRGAFITLKERGHLRGCIGHLAEDMTLCDVVGAMALQAAFRDYRFPPLRREELPEVEIEISVLTPARPVESPGEIVPGLDGVILSKAGRSAVFLPQVATEQGWNRETLLSQLAMKAGLAPDAWQSGAELLTFRAEVFAEAGGR